MRVTRLWMKRRKLICACSLLHTLLLLVSATVLKCAKQTFGLKLRAWHFCALGRFVASCQLLAQAQSARLMSQARACSACRPVCRRRAPPHATFWLRVATRGRPLCAARGPAYAGATAMGLSAPSAAVPTASELQHMPRLEQAVPSAAPASTALHVAVQGDDLVVEGTGPLLERLTAQACCSDPAGRRGC